MKPPPPSKRPRALRYAAGRTLRVVNRTDTAAEVIGPLAPGVRVTGLTAGQFSAIDAMEHMVDQLGPGCAVRISTWTSGLYDVRRAAEIRIEGRIADIRMLLDRGTFEKSPKYAGPLIEALGVEAFRCLSVHAKVIIVSGARGAAVMRSSMNLNKNLRTEQFDIDVCPEVSGFYTEWFDLLWDEAGRSQDNRAIIAAVYDRFRAQSEHAVKAPKQSDRPASQVARFPKISFSAQDLQGLLD